MKTKKRISGTIIRSTVVALLLSSAIVTLAFPRARETHPFGLKTFTVASTVGQFFRAKLRNSA